MTYITRCLGHAGENIHFGFSQACKKLSTLAAKVTEVFKRIVACLFPCFAKKPSPPVSVAAISSSFSEGARLELMQKTLTALQDNGVSLEQAMEKASDTRERPLALLQKLREEEKEVTTESISALFDELIKGHRLIGIALSATGVQEHYFAILDARKETKQYLLYCPEYLAAMSIMQKTKIVEAGEVKDCEPIPTKHLISNWNSTIAYVMSNLFKPPVDSINAIQHLPKLKMTYYTLGE